MIGNNRFQIGHSAKMPICVIGFPTELGLAGARKPNEGTEGT